MIACLLRSEHSLLGFSEKSGRHMLWEVEILPIGSEKDYEGQRVLSSASSQGIAGLQTVRAARTFLIQGELTQADVTRAAEQLLVDPVTEQFTIRNLLAATNTEATSTSPGNAASFCLNVLFHPGVTDSVAENAARALTELDFHVTNVATCRRYWVAGNLNDAHQNQLTRRIL
jgi:phosphoribosylformylglycinamidine (FGAM) synthase PurS component